MVINPDELLKELSEIEAKGVNTARLYISGKAVIVMPYHVERDGLSEKGSTGIGTTKRGIGPAYSDKMLRVALRFEDLLDLDYCKQRIFQIMPAINAQIQSLGGQQFAPEFIYDKCVYWNEKLGNRIIEPISYLHNAIKDNKNILFEGQLGVMKDIDLGIYPYVTSSNPLATYAVVSSGIPMKCVNNILGVAKAFSSAVGRGPFPTEMLDDEAAALRGNGQHIDDEFGASTGRARRLGWIDLPIIKYATMVNGFDELALLKIDKLDNAKTLKICTGYILDGKKIDYMPNTRELDRVEPIYIEVPGWMQDTRSIHKIADLPENAKKYIKIVEDYIGVPVKYVGVGPSRNDIAI